MGKPKIELVNYPQVYDFYSGYHPNRVAASILRYGLSAVLAPRVMYAQGAEQEIGALLDTERPIVLASNQSSGIDKFMIAALPMRVVALRKMAGRSFMPSRPPAQRSRIKRHVADVLGLVPIFDPADEKPKKYSARHQTHLHYKEASLRLSNICIAKIEAGKSMVVLANMQTDVPDSHRIVPLANSVGRIVCATAPQPPVIPMGIYHPEGKQPGQVPIFFIGSPSTEPFNNGTEATQWLNSRLQSCVNATVWQASIHTQAAR